MPVIKITKKSVGEGSPPPGLMKILGMGMGSEGSEESDEPSSKKARAVKAFYEACQAGEWNDAAHEFGIAYDLCMMGEGDEEETEEETEEDF